MGIKLNIGCGDQVLENWVNLDNKPYNEKVIKWQFGEVLPLNDGVVSVIYIAYFLMYLKLEDYKILFKECSRVLRKGGVMVIKEDNDKQRVWKAVGTNHSTGFIQSTSNVVVMEKELNSAGFDPFICFVGKDIELLINMGYVFLDSHKKVMNKSYVILATKAGEFKCSEI